MKRTEIGPARRFAVLARDRFRCRYCGRDWRDVTLVIDHVVPLCQGGTNEIGNLVAACRECNGGKGGLTVVQAAACDGSDPETDRWVEFLICRQLQCDVIDRRMVDQIVDHVREFGIDRVLRWMDMAEVIVSANNGPAFLRCLSEIRKFALRVTDGNEGSSGCLTDT